MVAVDSETTQRDAADEVGIHAGAVELGAPDPAYRGIPPIGRPVDVVRVHRQRDGGAPEPARWQNKAPGARKKLGSTPVPSSLARPIVSVPR